ncbi:hypothetical protein COT50_02685 [candidate division WWE3 bacterium CG08_land_8_20_14_0_20_41_10]|uniref:PIN domain-containing protein n=1 Tax=candidate division WWE3 bacterium CG08_land_8_20_14_0_20_41_10 TaxID=1975085 RepID=A0A2H0XBK0_UNCKA|nr:MAG: hypothetical protein COT50_02685 [candidate division WWE3 bacterium CG08_land_8_20_14_0_20_41_10]
MLNFLLDTSILIDCMRNKNGVKDFVDALNGEVGTSLFCISELYVGVYRSKRPKEEEAKMTGYALGLDFILGLDLAISKQFGELVGVLRNNGQPLDDFDVFIAATCLTNNLTLVTQNIKHFNRIPSLSMLSP